MMHGWIPPERYLAYLTWTDIRDLSALHTNQNGAFGTALANITPLQIPGKDNSRLLAELLIRMSMPESPILVTTVNQVLHGTRGIARVPRTPVARSMKHADIEPARFGMGVGER